MAYGLGKNRPTIGTLVPKTWRVLSATEGGALWKPGKSKNQGRKDGVKIAPGQTTTRENPFWARGDV